MTGLPTTSRLRAIRGHLPGVPSYFVLVDDSAETFAEPLPWSEAADVASELARAELGDPEAFTLLYNAARTRRLSHPHVHVLLARTVAEKRRALVFFQLKHLTRWWRWPVVRVLAAWRERHR